MKNSLYSIGTPLPYDFWLDGVMIYTPATFVTSDRNLTFWKWSGEQATYFDYLKRSGLTTYDGYVTYLYWNGTGDEYKSTTTNVQKYFICEASGNF
jgi:hypothetical protein